MNRENRAAWRGHLVPILTGAALLAAAAAGCQFVGKPAPVPVEILPPATSALPPTLAPQPIPTSGPVRVDVAGAVVVPGVYRLPPDSIVADAIESAGGPAADADLDRLNKAAPLLDGMQVYVPHRGQPTPQLVAPAQPSATAGVRAGSVPIVALININTATQPELESLPGIGPALAERIIAGRPYQRVEDLVAVRGIGEATLARFRDQITVQ